MHQEKIARLGGRASTVPFGFAVEHPYSAESAQGGGWYEVECHNGWDVLGEIVAQGTNWSVDSSFLEQLCCTLGTTEASISFPWIVLKYCIVLYLVCAKGR